MGSEMCIRDSVWCMLAHQLPSVCMEAWEEQHEGASWLPPAFRLSVPQAAAPGAAPEAAADAPAEAAAEAASAELPTEDSAPASEEAEAEATAPAAEAPAAAASEDAAAAEDAATEPPKEEARKPTVSLMPASLQTAAETEGCEVVRYELQAMICFTQSVLAHATEGSGHLTLAFRLPAMHRGADAAEGAAAVSYTHLTLPTKRIV